MFTFDFKDIIIISQIVFKKNIVENTVVNVRLNILCVF